jgi:hypothetical protein
MQNREALARLRKSEVVLMSKNSPAILYRHGRWHLVTLGFVIGPHMESKKGISCVNFMSPYRARKNIKEWLPYCDLIAFDEVGKIFRQELECKVLPTAEDYRPLLKNGLVELAGGYTTDTLHRAIYDTSIEDAFIAAIDTMIQEGKMGPFLHFGRSFKVIQKEL